MRQRPDNRLSGLLYPVRDAYVARFEAFLVDLRSKVRSFVVEPEIRGSGGEATRRGALDTIARYDVIAKTLYGSIKAFAVDSEERLDFPQARFDEDGLDVGVAPFLWESMEVWTDGQADAVSRALAFWFNAAAAPLASTGHQTIQGVAHFISDPVSEGGVTTCVIDLGTAPVEAVMSLLGHLRLAGASWLDLGRLQMAAPAGGTRRLAGG